MGICLRCGITMDLNLNSLFIKYIKEGFPSIVSIDGGIFLILIFHSLALLLLSLYSRDSYQSFSQLFNRMKTIQQGQTSDIESLMLDCSLPGYPSVNLLPEIVSIETPFYL